MKNYSLLLICFLLASVKSYSQSNFIASWDGKMSIGTNTLRIVIHIEGDGNGTLLGKMDSPDQGVKGIKCSSVTVVGDSVIVELKVSGGKFVGKLTDASHLSGYWQQGGRNFPMILEKESASVGPKRSQVPKAPFGYRSEDVVYHNADNSIQYGATITIPEGAGPFPALVLITGSGLEDRNEEVFGHKPFEVIADYLSRKGYVVLRVDDRSIGQSTGDVRHATTADFAKDVNVSFDYLKARKEVDAKKVGLLGHSEGGLIAPMVASARKDVDFIILFAGIGEKPAKLMAEQNAAILEKSGMPKESIVAYIALYNELIKIAIHSKDKTNALDGMTKAVDTWKAKTSKTIVENTTGIHDGQSEQTFVDQFATQVTSDWFKYFLSIDPAVYLTKLSCKVLAMNGSKDIQVVSKSNLAGIKASLAKSKSKTYEIKELEGMNHLFQKCTSCTVEEYESIEETTDPVALQTIGDWLDKNVK